MKLTLHAGHNPDGKSGCGAICLIKESTEARKVVSEMITYLKAGGNTVYDCTVNNGTGQNDVLSKLVRAMNNHTKDTDFNVSIHFNSGASDKTGNGKTTGTEVLLYSASSALKAKAQAVCSAFEKAGFKNRGIKYRPDLYIMRNTSKPTMLIEVCFVDDKDDVILYQKTDIAKLIVEALTGKGVPATPTVTTKPVTESSSTTKTFVAGQKVVLSNTALYISSTATSPAKSKTGTFYIFNPTIIRGRIRITNMSSNVNVVATGWVNINDL